MDIKPIIENSKDYQLQSLIRWFAGFRKEVSTNTADEILMISVQLAKNELDKRGVPHTI